MQNAINQLKAALSAFSLPELAVCHAAFVKAADRLGQTVVLDVIGEKAPALYARYYNEEEYDLDVPGLLAEIEGGSEDEK